MQHPPRLLDGEESQPLPLDFAAVIGEVLGTGDIADIGVDLEGMLEECMDEEDFEEIADELRDNAAAGEYASEEEAEELCLQLSGWRARVV